MRTAENKARTYERTFREIKRLSASGLEARELLRRTAERLGKAVPFASYCLTTVDPASTLMTQVVNGGAAYERGHAEVLGRELARMYFEEDMDRLGSMLRGRRTAQPLSETTGGMLHRSLRYREYLKPQGLGNEVAGIFVDGGLWGAGYLTREAGEPDFDHGEISLLERVAPHVGAGLKVSALRASAGDGARGPDTPGVLTLDRQGRVLSYTPAGEQLLSELEELRPGWRGSESPIPVQMVAGALRRALSPGSEGGSSLVPKIRLRGRSGRWMTLHASLSESTDGRLGETVVVIAPSAPQEVAELNVASCGLTRREEDIVKLVARGHSTKQVSDELFISGYTVNNHLRSIFEKVGVHSRRELVQRLFVGDLLTDGPGG